MRWCRPFPFHLDVSSSPSILETPTTESAAEAAADMNFLKRLFKNRSPSDPSSSSVMRSSSCSRETLDRISNEGGDSHDSGATCAGTTQCRRTRSKSASRSSTPSGSQTSLPGVVMRPPPIITRTREVRMSSCKHLALILPGLLLGKLLVCSSEFSHTYGKCLAKCL